MKAVPSAYLIAERTATLFTMLALFGSAAFRVGVLRMTAKATPNTLSEQLSGVAMQAGWAAGAVLLVLALVRLNGQVVTLFDGWRNASGADVRALLLHTTWGYGLLLQFAAAVIVTAGAFIGRPLDAAMMIPLALSMSLMGHAAAAKHFTAVSIAADTIHALAAGAWVGGVAYVWLATRIAADQRELLRIVRAFSPIALTCAACVAATGTFAALQHIPSMHALTSSVYGTQLLVKLSLVTATLCAGYWNWRRGTPALDAGRPETIRRGVTLEVFFAIAVSFATSRLIVLPPPPVY